jgi:murein DD-endopeptidase MepM/ murein hydrolase activator NlpD
LGGGLVAAVVLVAVPSARAADAQSDPTDTTSTTAPSTVPADPSTTTTTEPGGASATTSSTVPGATTTTTAPGAVGPPAPVPPEALPPEVTIPPEIADDPRAPILLNPSPDDGGEIPVFQGLYNPATNQVIRAKVAELEVKVAGGLSRLAGIRAALVDAEAEAREVASDFDELGARSKTNVAAAAEAERKLRSHTVEAFMHGSTDDIMALVRADDPVQLGIARQMLDSVIDSDEEVVDRHRDARAALDAEESELAVDLADVEERVRGLTEEHKSTLEATTADAQALDAYRRGAQVYVKGFVFPVMGPVEFIDSWGYPRMTGTPSAHWHQGTDVFAAMGTPLVACESGTLERIGTASLGGNKLWVRGDSGTEYYYAHLVAFASGIHDGMRVNAGDVIGFVGDTGNARGTPPHLHFEIHPGGGDAVNPYPLLRSAHGAQPMAQVVPPPPVPDPAAVAGGSAVPGATVAGTTPPAPAAPGG